MREKFRRRSRVRAAVFSNGLAVVRVCAGNECALLLHFHTVQRIRAEVLRL